MARPAKNRLTSLFPAILGLILLSGGVYFAGGSLIYSLVLLITGFLTVAVVYFVQGKSPRSR